jgi:hypothetical protein
LYPQVADLTLKNLMEVDACSSAGEIEALVLQQVELVASEAIPVAWDLQPYCTLTVSRAHHCTAVPPLCTCVNVEHMWLDAVSHQGCFRASVSMCLPVCDVQEDGKWNMGARLYLLMRRFDMCFYTYLTTRLHLRSPHRLREVHISNLITSLAQVRKPTPLCVGDEHCQTNMRRDSS